MTYPAMQVATGIAGLVLLLAGLVKIRASRALSLSDSLPVVRLAPLAATRLLGATELVIGLSLVVGIRGANVVAAALLYAVFAVVVTLLPMQNCACFGAEQEPLIRSQPLHVALNLAAAGNLIAHAVAARGSVPLADALTVSALGAVVLGAVYCLARTVQSARRLGSGTDADRVITARTGEASV